MWQPAIILKVTVIPFCIINDGQQCIHADNLLYFVFNQELFFLHTDFLECLTYFSCCDTLTMSPAKWQYMTAKYAYFWRDGQHNKSGVGTHPKSPPPPLNLGDQNPRYKPTIHRDFFKFTIIPCRKWGLHFVMVSLFILLRYNQPPLII